MTMVLIVPVVALIGAGLLAYTALLRGRCGIKAIYRMRAEFDAQWERLDRPSVRSVTGVSWHRLA